MVFNFDVRAIWHLAPPFGVTPFEFRETFGIRKLVLGLSRGVVSVILHLAVLRQYQCVTDRQTDGRTRDDSIPRYSIASRIKNDDVGVNRLCSDSNGV